MREVEEACVQQELAELTITSNRSDVSEEHSDFIDARPMSFTGSVTADAVGTVSFSPETYQFAMQPDSFNNANLDGWLEDAVDHAELFDGFDRWSFIPEDSPSSEERSFEATIECVQGSWLLTDRNDDPWDNSMSMRTNSTPSLASDKASPRTSGFPTTPPIDCAPPLHRLPPPAIAKSSSAKFRMQRSGTLLKQSKAILPASNRTQRASHVRKEGLKSYCNEPGCPSSREGIPKCFTRPSDLERHRNSVHGAAKSRFHCNDCSHVSPRKDKMERHCEKRHENKKGFTAKKKVAPEKNV